MAGVTDAGLAAAVSEAGGLGTIAAATESAESLTAEIRRLRIAPVRMLANQWTERMEQLISTGASKKDIMKFIFSGDPMSGEDGPFACG